MQTVTINTFKFEELSPEAQATAIEQNSDLNFYEGWWESIYEDAKNIATLMGWDISKIYFSGFYSQGDGACFEGECRYKKGCLKAVKEYAPVDETLHSIAERWQEIQRKNFYQLSANSVHTGYYYHSRSTTITVEKLDTQSGWVSGETENEVESILIDFMDWIYSQLDKDNDYQSSHEAIQEAIIANEYDFTEDGKRW